MPKLFLIYKFVSRLKNTSIVGKLLLTGALGYLLLPFDLSPDFIPLLGQLDDAAVVPILIYIAWKLAPAYLTRNKRSPVKNNSVSEL